MVEWVSTPCVSLPCTSADIYALGAILSDVLGRRCARLDAPAAIRGATARRAPAQALAALRAMTVGNWASWPRVLFASFNTLLRPAPTYDCPCPSSH